MKKLSSSTEHLETSPTKTKSITLAKDTDLVAKKVSWKPANPGGTKFKITEMVSEEGKLKVKLSRGVIIFGYVLLCGGILTLTIFSSAIYDQARAYFLVTLVHGGVSTFIGCYLIYQKKLHTFDKIAGKYYKGEYSNQAMDESESEAGYIDNIHSIQLIREHVAAKETTYYSYELNIVLKDASRINIMDHSHLKNIKKSAEMLSAYIGVPILTQPQELTYDNYYDKPQNGAWVGLVFTVIVTVGSLVGIAGGALFAFIFRGGAFLGVLIAVFVFGMCMSKTPFLKFLSPELSNNLHDGIWAGLIFTFIVIIGGFVGFIGISLCSLIFQSGGAGVLGGLIILFFFGAWISTWIPKWW